MTMVQERGRPELEVIPERKVYGKHTYKPVPARNLIMMPQVRGNLNPDFYALKEDIRDKGLLEPPDVVEMTREGLANYIDFINSVWSSDVQVEDYDRLAIDGVYNLVAAGHTRSRAILEIADEEDDDPDIVSKIHETDDPFEIISIQMRENLHSKPPQERTALAIVEAYLIGVRQGLWKDEEGFVAAKGDKFSRDQVSDAVGFARLPETIRDFVFAGQLPYNAALALGRGSEMIAEHVQAQLGYAMIVSDEQEEQFTKAYNKKVALIVAMLTNRPKMNSTASKKFIQARIDELEQITRKLLGVTDINSPTIAVPAAKNQDEIYLRQLNREYIQAMQEVAARPVAATETALRLYTRLTGVDSVEAQATAERGRERLVRSMGDVGLFDIASPSDVDIETELSSPLFDFGDEAIA